MIIYRYIARELLVTLLALTSVVVAVFIINQFVHYIGHVAEGRYSMLSLMQLMAVMVPLIAGYLIPLAFYLSILLVFGKWYVNQEMVVLQACGLGFKELLIKVLGIAVLVSVLVGFLTLYVDPKVQRLNNKVLVEIAQQSVISHIVPQSFTSLSRQQTFYTSTVSRDRKRLSDVFLAEHLNNGDWRITTAKNAYEVKNQPWAGRYLLFESGSQSNLNQKQNTYDLGLFEQYGALLDIPYKKISSWPEDASTAKLLPDYWKNSKVAAELQWRLSIPLSVPLLALLAVPLSHIRPRQGQYGRLFPAILIYLAYADFLWVGRSWVADGKVSSWLGMWWIHVALLLCSLMVFLHRFGGLSSFSLLIRKRSA